MSEHAIHATASHAAHDGHEHEHGHVHIMPPGILIAVFVALLVLTFITVAVTRVDLGPLNIWIAMGVATAKATLVALYFMHLKYDNRFNLLVFLGSFLFVGFFVAITMLDTGQYQHSIQQRTESLKTGR
jgi:cytochrome c oxidase subunit 4